MRMPVRDSVEVSWMAVVVFFGLLARLDWNWRCWCYGGQKGSSSWSWGLERWVRVDGIGVV